MIPMIRFPNLDFLFSFNRKIASGLVPFMVRTPLRPNDITSLSLLCGFIAAYFMARGSRVGLLTGAFFLQVSFILDNCDGAVARLKSMQSDFGKWYDLTADLLVDFSLWVGLAIAAMSGLKPGCGWVLVAATAAFVGSFINFLRVIRDRSKGHTGKETPDTSNPFWSALHVLSRDGDPSLLVWIMAAFAQPWQFLMLGACYINFIWMMEMVRGFFRKPEA